jgi:carbon-monoxide dehydrogenase iron sulfur subunit
MDEAANVIRIEKIRCTGCGWCIEACDFGAITPDHTAKTVAICDLCEGRSMPKCVEFCPKGALTVETQENEAQNLRDKAASNMLQ